MRSICLGSGSPHHLFKEKSIGPFSPSIGVNVEYTNTPFTVTSNGFLSSFSTSTGSFTIVMFSVTNFSFK